MAGSGAHAQISAGCAGSGRRLYTRYHGRPGLGGQERCRAGRARTGERCSGTGQRALEPALFGGSHALAGPRSGGAGSARECIALGPGLPALRRRGHPCRWRRAGPRDRGCGGKRVADRRPGIVAAVRGRRVVVCGDRQGAARCGRCPGRLRGHPVSGIAYSRLVVRPGTAAGLVRCPADARRADLAARAVPSRPDRRQGGGGAICRGGCRRSFATFTNRR